MTSRDETDVARIARLIKGIRIATVTTVMADGHLHSRPMATEDHDFDGTLWFFTDRESAKVHELEKSARVGVAYADPSDNHYVTLSGRGTIVDDRAKIRELWNVAAKAWFPDGPDDPSCVLLEVKPEIGWYWDGPPNKLVLALKTAAAIAKGEKADEAMGDHGMVRF